MSYNPDAMTIIVSGDLPPEMADQLKNQLTADVLTAQEFGERERVLAQQQEIEQDTEENRVEAGLEEKEGDEFSAPDESEIGEVDVADTSGGEEGGEDFEDPEGEAEEPEIEEAETTDEDMEDVSEEDAKVKDDLDEPNAAFEHAQAGGSKEVGMYLKLGVARYKRRVRRERELTLAQETLQMDNAQRQKLIRRLLYIKPNDTGFTSKLQTMISTINPNDWVVLIDSANASGDSVELTTKQIREALDKAGIEMYDSVDTLADSLNQLQKAITEPSGTQNDDAGMF